jgi:hypothetical protein
VQLPASCIVHVNRTVALRNIGSHTNATQHGMGAYGAARECKQRCFAGLSQVYTRGLSYWPSSRCGDMTSDIRHKQRTYLCYAWAAGPHLGVGSTEMGTEGICMPAGLVSNTCGRVSSLYHHCQLNSSKVCLTMKVHDCAG